MQAGQLIISINAIPDSCEKVKELYNDKMPIEIKELHIRVTVTPPDSRQEKGSLASMPERDTALSGGAKLEIIAECVEQVLKILENKKDR